MSVNFPSSIWDGDLVAYNGLANLIDSETLPHLLRSLAVDLLKITNELVAVQTYLLTPIYFTANGATLNYGTSADTVADLQNQLDGAEYTIQEATGVPGIELEVDFVNVTYFTQVLISAYYDGSTTHAVRIQLYNYDTEDWDTIDTLMSSLDIKFYSIRVPDPTNYISGGAVIVRFYHTESGNASHDMHISWCGLG